MISPLLVVSDSLPSSWTETIESMLDIHVCDLCEGGTADDFWESADSHGTRWKLVILVLRAAELREVVIEWCKEKQFPYLNLYASVTGAYHRIFEDQTLFSINPDRSPRLRALTRWLMRIEDVTCISTPFFMEETFPRKELIARASFLDANQGCISDFQKQLVEWILLPEIRIKDFSRAFLNDVSGHQHTLLSELQRMKVNFGDSDAWLLSFLRKNTNVPVHLRSVLETSEWDRIRSSCLCPIFEWAAAYYVLPIPVLRELFFQLLVSGRNPLETFTRLRQLNSKLQRPTDSELAIWLISCGSWHPNYKFVFEAEVQNLGTVAQAAAYIVAAFCSRNVQVFEKLIAIWGGKLRDAMVEGQYLQGLLMFSCMVRRVYRSASVERYLAQYEKQNTSEFSEFSRGTDQSLGRVNHEPRSMKAIMKLLEDYYLE